jgi:hypothetical protein
MTSTGNTSDDKPVSVKLALAFLIFMSIVLVPALISAYRQGDAGVHRRYFEFGVILTVTFGTLIGSMVLGAVRRRAVKAALSRNAPLRLQATRRRRLAFSIVILAIAAGSVVEITDPTVPVVNSAAPIFVALFTVPLGVICLIGSMLSGSSITIDGDGIACPTIWQGTIGYRSIRAARLATIDSGFQVVVTVDPPDTNALVGNDRRFKSLLPAERPIPTSSFDIAPKALIARIEQNRDGA